MVKYEGRSGKEADLEQFSEAINIIRRRHLDTVPQMAMAVVKLNQKGDISEGVSDTIQYFLDRLYINRSGQRIASSPLHERAISGSQSTC